jgi:hypothetical protein
VHPHGKVERTGTPQTERATEGSGSLVPQWWHDGGSRQRGQRGALSGHARP